jgi:type I restriction enzyme S subunit
LSVSNSKEPERKGKARCAQLSEQHAITDFLDCETAKLERMAAKVQEAIARLQEYRTALTTVAVTGKINVRGADAHASAQFVTKAGCRVPA